MITAIQQLKFEMGVVSDVFASMLGYEPGDDRAVHFLRDVRTGYVAKGDERKQLLDSWPQEKREAAAAAKKAEEAAKKAAEQKQQAQPPKQ